MKKEAVFYDEANIGGACMRGEFMTKKEEQETATFISKYKANKQKKQPKKMLQKTFA